MHPNPIFRTTNAQMCLAFARSRGFGVLSVTADPVPLMAHAPFLLSETVDCADIHLVRSNPIARRAAEAPVPAVIVISGPDSYVSPDWYGVNDQVPTWNYLAVHLSGRLSAKAPEEMRAMLDRQSADFERRLSPKQAWHMDKMTPGVRDRMMRMIVPFRFDVTGLDGTWKLGQNKPDAVRLRAADHIAREGIGLDPAALAELMKAPPDL